MTDGQNASSSTNSQSLLNQQLDQLQSLQSVITDEKLILQQHQPQALIDISKQKNELLLAIQQLDKEISINQQFAQDKAAGLLNENLDKVKVLLQHCQQQNNINGMIIQQSQLAVERMKTSLLENHNKSSITYNSKGKKSGGLSSIGLKA